MRRFHSDAVLLAATFALAFGLSAARAQDAQTFYKSHPITFGASASAGSAYDLYMRALSRHLPDHVPGNPSVIVQNVPAAGGMVLANMMYSSVPKDGSYIGMVRGTVIQQQVFNDPQAQFDSRRLAWIGNMSGEYDACIVSAASGIKSVDDFYKREVVVGASGAGAGSYSYPQIYKEFLGMKFKIIFGYPGTPERVLAMERGELTGACGVSTAILSSSFSTQIKDGAIRMITQGGVHKDPRYPNVPNMLDEAKTPDAREALEFIFATLTLGRPIAAPPETPPDRLAVLRKAFMDTLGDPEFLADAKKSGVDIEGTDDQETAKLVEQMFATPAAIVARVKAAMSN